MWKNDENRELTFPTRKMYKKPFWDAKRCPWKLSKKWENAHILQYFMQTDINWRYKWIFFCHNLNSTSPFYAENRKDKSRVQFQICFLHGA